MAVDILSVNALHRKTANNRKERKVQLALRDSAIAAQGATNTYIDSWNTVIAGLDSDITNFSQTYENFDSFHLYWNTNTHYETGSYYAFRCGIKRLCNYGAITGNFSVLNTSGSHMQCGQSCTWTVPGGVSRVGVTGTAAGGTSKGMNCCGGDNGGPLGSYISTIFCVEPGDIFCFCSGCAYCCFYYCCGYSIECSGSSYVCTSGSGIGSGCICLRSPSPYACVEMKNRGAENIARCGGIRDGCYYSCIMGGGCCCHAMFWGGKCMCNTCGNSICTDNNWACQYFGCRSNATSYDCQRVMSGVSFQRDLYGMNGCCQCCSNDVCCNAVYVTPALTNKMVPNSCFPWMGGWQGGWVCDNCWSIRRITHPYGLSVGIQTVDCNCVTCWNQCCPACIHRANQNYYCYPGYGGSNGLYCGGATNYYADMGRHGAWCVQYC